MLIDDFSVPVGPLDSRSAGALPVLMDRGPASRVVGGSRRVEVEIPRNPRSQPVHLDSNGDYLNVDVGVRASVLLRLGYGYPDPDVGESPLPVFTEDTGFDFEFDMNADPGINFNIALYQGGGRLAKGGLAQGLRVTPFTVRTELSELVSRPGTFRYDWARPPTRLVFQFTVEQNLSLWRVSLT